MKRLALVSILLSAFARPADVAPTVPDPVTMPEIKAYCLDFNWQGKGRKSKIADPGFMKGANPEAVVAWKPNIIFVVADDMGFKDTGYSGNPIARTPHLDRMAAEFLRFDYFYSAAGTCSPGRMAILTGRTPLRARMVTTVGPMQEGEVTVAAALKTIGYETAQRGMDRRSPHAPVRSSHQTAENGIHCTLRHPHRPRSGKQYRGPTSARSPAYA